MGTFTLVMSGCSEIKGAEKNTLEVNDTGLPPSKLVMYIIIHKYITQQLQKGHIVASTLATQIMLPS